MSQFSKYSMTSLWIALIGSQCDHRLCCNCSFGLLGHLFYNVSVKPKNDIVGSRKCVDFDWTILSGVT